MTDPTDITEVEADAVVAFTGLVQMEQNRIDHGMLFSGHKAVMAEVISAIPPQVHAFVKEQTSRENETKIVMPNGEEKITN